MRTGFLRREFAAAIEDGEIIDTFTPEELTNIFYGFLTRDLLNRRIENENRSHTQVATVTLDKLTNMIRKNP